LKQWKTDPSRKPLILTGARQVGKTHALKTFGAMAYQTTVYVNFENEPRIHDLFLGSLKPSDIIKILSIKGAMTENYVAQELARQGYGLYYWTSSGQAELDFVLQHQDVIYPIEVKSGASLKKKSLWSYQKKYHPTLSIRASAMNLKKDETLLNCPLYLLEYVTNFL